MELIKLMINELGGISVRVIKEEESEFLKISV